MCKAKLKRVIARMEKNAKRNKAEAAIIRKKLHILYQLFEQAKIGVQCLLAFFHLI